MNSGCEDAQLEYGFDGFIIAHFPRDSDGEIERERKKERERESERDREKDFRELERYGARRFFLLQLKYGWI